MKSMIASALLFVASAFAQSIEIVSPASGATVMAGQGTNVQLAFPNSLTGVQHISVVISYISCSVQPCSMNATEMLGDTLYSGNYTPTFSTDPSQPPSQNFTVTIPSNTDSGDTLLNVAHFYLLGASSQPILEFANTTINLDNSTSTSSKRYIRGREVPL